MKLNLRIPGVPVSQPRAKAVTIAGRTRLYTPTSRKRPDGKRVSNGVAEFKALVALVAAENYDGPLLSEPLRVDCCWVFPRTKAQTWKRKPMPRLPYTGKIDRDNLDKMILDSLQGVVWSNDTYVQCGWLEKWHAAGDEQPHTLVVIETIGEEAKER